MNKTKLLKQKKNFNSIYHSCVSENPVENKAEMTESGRSMVEMLGVLAVMGVLSVAGVGGYTNAMNRHRANELLNEASKRATVVAAQAMQGRETFSINEFPNNEALKFSTEVPHDKTNGQFTLEIGGVSEAVCQQMNNAKGPVIRKFEPATCSGDNNTVKLTYNDDMSATEKASDFNGDPDHCPGKYCTGSNTCVDTGANCTCSGTTPECQTCDTDTGSYVADSSQDGDSCNSGAGTCNNGTCETASSCSDTKGDFCTDNSTVCPGYYCSTAGGTSTQDSVSGKQWCGDAVYTPGAGTVESLGTPREPKTGYLSSPSYVASWDAAVNYCKALKSTIAQGVTVNGINYGNYGSLSNGLASLPSGCSLGNSCSALPDDDMYLLDGLLQWDCDWKNYSTTYGSGSCYAFSVDYGSVDNYYRDDDAYALCE